MYKLGIHDGHNSSVSLFKDDLLIYALQEERLCRTKNYWGAPILSLKHIIKSFELNAENVESISFAGFQHTGKASTSRLEYSSYTKLSLLAKPKVQQKVLRPFISIFNKTFNSRKDLDHRIAFLESPLVNELHKAGKVYEIEHHLCHIATASSALNPLIYPNNLIITSDGFGDGICGSVSRVKSDGKVETISTFPEMASIAKIYAWTTIFLGFTHLEHEYKLMGLAPYANQHYSEILFEKLENLFTFKDGIFYMSNSLGGSACKDSDIFAYLSNIFKYERFDTICGALQLWTEKSTLQLLDYWINKYNPNYIGLSGGLFMNVKLNLLIRNKYHEKKIFIYPSCGDETNSIGAALCTNPQSKFNSKNQLKINSCYTHTQPVISAYLGDSTDTIYNEALKYGNYDSIGLNIEVLSDTDLEVSKLIAKGEVVARVSGREEFGARALGNRSLLCSPTNLAAKEHLNNLIKSRDFWMPFAGALRLENAELILEDFSEYYDPEFMIMCYNTINADKYPCCVHPADKTIRPQVVTKESNPSFWKLLEKFEEVSNSQVLLNTSLNLHGYPVVHTFNDCLDLLQKSGLKYMSIEDILITKH